MVFLLFPVFFYYSSASGTSIYMYFDEYAYTFLLSFYLWVELPCQELCMCSNVVDSVKKGSTVIV